MMKFLFFISLLFLSVISFAQYPNGVQYLGTDSNVVQARGGLKARIIPYVYADTTAANLQRIRQYPGAEIYTSVDNKKWFRSSTVDYWVQVTSGESGLFARSDARNNTGNNMYFSAADNSFSIDSVLNFNITTTSGSMNFLSSGGITLQSDNTSSLTMSTNQAIYNGGDWGFKTPPTHTVSIGDDISGTNTLSLYAPNGTVAFVQSASGSGLALAAGNSIYLQPSSYTSNGQIIISPTATSGFIVQRFLTGGSAILGEIGIATYGVDELQWYLRPVNSYDPVGEDSIMTYLNLVNKIKLTNIPNDDAVTKIIGIDAEDNVRYINTSSLGGTNIYNSDGILTADRFLTGRNGTYGLFFDSLANFDVKSYSGSLYSNVFLGPTLLQIGYAGTSFTSSLNASDGLIYMTADNNAVSIDADSVRISTLGISNDTTAKKILTVNPVTGALGYANWIGSGASGITIGTTNITSGANTRILYNNSGVVGEYTLTGTGTVAVMATSPTFVTDLTVPKINGSTSSGANLTLMSTTNATKGKILFGTSGYDEVNNRLGIGTASPATTLDLNGGTALVGAVQTTGVGVSSNLFTASTTLMTGTTTANYLMPGGTGIDFRLAVNGTTVSVSTAGRDIADVVFTGSVTGEAASSTHPRAGTLFVGSKVMSNGAGATDTLYGAYINGPATGVTAATGSWNTIHNLGNVLVKFGNLSVGVGSPTAAVHLRASTTAAGSGQIKFVEGSALTSPEDGNLNYVSNNLQFTETSTVYTLAKTLTNTATLDFGDTAPGTSTDLTVTVTGAAEGDAVYIGVPNGSTAANSSYTAWVSSTNTVTIRFFNIQTAGNINPASGTFRAVVTKY